MFQGVTAKCDVVYVTLAVYSAAWLCLAPGQTYWSFVSKQSRPRQCWLSMRLFASFRLLLPCCLRTRHLDFSHYLMRNFKVRELVPPTLLKSYFRWKANQMTLPVCGCKAAFTLQPKWPKSISLKSEQIILDIFISDLNHFHMWSYICFVSDLRLYPLSERPDQNLRFNISPFRSVVIVYVVVWYIVCVLEEV